MGGAAQGKKFQDSRQNFFMHEHTPKHHNHLHGSSNRFFGFVFATAFLFFAFYPLFVGQGVRRWAVFVAFSILVLALFTPKVLGPLNLAWTKLGMLLHRIVSPVFLGLLFYMVVTPTGLLMRLLGNDPLRLRRDESLTSYWIDRKPPGPEAGSLNNQF
jgi:cytochrome c oxidase subunit IV